MPICEALTRQDTSPAVTKQDEVDQPEQDHRVGDVVLEQAYHDCVSSLRSG
jgi:hypothetical protein